MNEENRHNPIPKVSLLAPAGSILGICLGACVLIGFGFWLGRTPVEAPSTIPPVLAAAASGSDTMAVATGPISDDAEGIFFLDFLTGDLQCLVYYPRSGAFGARFVANVAPNLGASGRNSKYLMVTGGAITKATTGGNRPAQSLVYVTDTNSGMFAAYAVPWNRTAESSGKAQGGQLVYAGGGPIRNFQIRDAQQNQPAAVQDPQQQR